jgi:hypothetical protein
MSTFSIDTLGHRSRPAASRSHPWPLIRNAAKSALVILALMAVAMTPAVIRLWLFFPAVHHG